MGSVGAGDIGCGVEANAFENPCSATASTGRSRWSGCGYGSRLGGIVARRIVSGYCKAVGRRCGKTRVLETRLRCRSHLRTVSEHFVTGHTHIVRRRCPGKIDLTRGCRRRRQIAWNRWRRCVRWRRRRSRNATAGSIFVEPGITGRRISAVNPHGDSIGVNWSGHNKAI